MDIKIEDYLSEEEIKEICKDVLYQKLGRDEIMYTIAHVLTDRLLPEKEEI